MLKLVFVAIVSVTLGVGSCSGQDHSSESKDRESVTKFEETIRPLLMQYCVDCHGPEADFLAAATATDAVGLRDAYASVFE